MKKLFYLAIIGLGLSQKLPAQNENAMAKQCNIHKDGIAINGYDPVAYFSANKAIKGKKEIQCLFNGLTYQFANPQNRETFKSNPSKFQPQYGGWCAYAMGTNGSKVDVDPETFKILDGKLYLFYNKFFNNTLESWNKDEIKLKEKADDNWKKYVH